ncbi:MAG: hypothetical protein LBI06_07740 [Treponema sp.]|nr:hypothetical protein [Treponema sp.]
MGNMRERPPVGSQRVANISGRSVYARLKPGYRYCKQWNSLTLERFSFTQSTPLGGAHIVVPPPKQTFGKINNWAAEVGTSKAPR